MRVDEPSQNIPIDTLQLLVSSQTLKNRNLPGQVLVMDRLILILLLFIPIEIWAQNYVFRHFGVEDGLPSSEVYYCLQDRRGYMWFGTDNGVSRYNGKEFENFTTADGLTDNVIFEIFEDVIGRIWFITYKGPLCYWYNDSIYEYEFNEKLFSEIETFNLTIGKNYKYFYSNTEFYIDNELNLYYCLTTGFNAKIDSIGKIEFMSDTNYSFTIFNIENKAILRNHPVFPIKRGVEIIPIENAGNIKYLKIDYSQALTSPGDNKALSKDSLLAISFKNNLLIYEVDTLLASLIFPRQIIAMMFVSNFELHIGFMDNGLISVSYPFNDKSTTKKYLNNQSVTSFITDFEGGMWITTLDNGIFYLFDELFEKIDIQDGLASSKLNTMIVDDDDNFFLGLNRGLVNKLSNNGAIAIFKEKDFEIDINKFAKYKNNEIIVGTNNGLAKIFNNQLVLDKSLFVKSDFSELESVFTVKSICILNDSTLYLVGSRGFMSIINGRTDFYLPMDKSGLRGESGSIGPDDSLWIGTFNGLVKYKDRQFNFNYRKDSLLSKRIKDLCVFQKEVWLGTKAYGIIVTQQDTTLIIKKHIDDLNEAITAMVADSQYVYVGTKAGIYIYDGFTKKLAQVLTKNDGLTSNEINDLLIDKGTLYVSTSNGLTYFKTSDIDYDLPFPILNIERVINNGKKLDKTISVDLPYKENNMVFDYLAISFKQEKANRYKYRLIGFDDDWKITNKTQAQYPYLPHGDYTFEVTSENEIGDWNPNPVSYSFVVQKPYWLKGWFILLEVLAGLLTLFGLYRILTHRKRKKQEIKQLIYQLREESLVRQMNPHFIFNSLNSIQKYVVENDSLASSSYLSNFARLIRQTLVNTQHPQISLADELTTLVIFIELEKVRSQSKFDYHIHIPQDLSVYRTRIPTFFIQPLVENAIWHGMKPSPHKGLLQIRFSVQNNELLHIEVEDNGIGRQAAGLLREKKHKSLGTNIIQKRIELIRLQEKLDIKLEYKDLKDEKGQAKGTLVVINLPLIVSSDDNESPEKSPEEFLRDLMRSI